jgi:hypothetical protein
MEIICIGKLHSFLPAETLYSGSQIQGNKAGKPCVYHSFNLLGKGLPSKHETVSFFEKSTSYQWQLKLVNVVVNRESMSAICVILHLSCPYLGDDPLLQINQQKSSSLSLLLPPYYTYIYKTKAAKPRAGGACVTCGFGLRTSRVDRDGHANV